MGQRNHQINVRLTQNEYKSVFRRARKIGMTVSTYLRMTLMQPLSADEMQRLQQVQILRDELVELAKKCGEYAEDLTGLGLLAIVEKPESIDQ